MYSSVDGYLGCHVLAIVNSAAMNTGVHVSLNYGFLRVYAQSPSNRVKSEREKQILHINVSYVEARKMVQMNPFARQEQRCRGREWMCGPGEVEVSGMNWEIGTDVYTPLYVKQIN